MIIHLKEAGQKHVCTTENRTLAYTTTQVHYYSNPLLIRPPLCWTEGSGHSNGGPHRDTAVCLYYTWCQGSSQRKESLIREVSIQRDYYTVNVIRYMYRYLVTWPVQVHILLQCSLTVREVLIQRDHYTVDVIRYRYLVAWPVQVHITIMQSDNQYDQ